MRKLISLFVSLAVLAPVWGVGSAARAQQSQRPREGGARGSSNAAATETLIRNATVLTITHGTLANTDILIRNGKIAGVGQNLKAS
ncbi:MAG: hypothetical protein QOD28_3880, partial [Acidobacteriota bacterium]|nr:hypothetical protein [Acidobacteriota bacterium]